MFGNAQTTYRNLAIGLKSYGQALFFPLHHPNTPKPVIFPSTSAPCHPTVAAHSPSAAPVAAAGPEVVPLPASAPPWQPCSPPLFPLPTTSPDAAPLQVSTPPRQPSRPPLLPLPATTHVAPASPDAAPLQASAPPRQPRGPPPLPLPTSTPAMAAPPSASAPIGRPSLLPGRTPIANRLGPLVEPATTASPLLGRPAVCLCPPPRLPPSAHPSPRPPCCATPRRRIAHSRDPLAAASLAQSPRHCDPPPLPLCHIARCRTATPAPPSPRRGSPAVQLRSPSPLPPWLPPPPPTRPPPSLHPSAAAPRSHVKNRGIFVIKT